MAPLDGRHCIDGPARRRAPGLGKYVVVAGRSRLGSGWDLCGPPDERRGGVVCGFTLVLL